MVLEKNYFSYFFTYFTVNIVTMFINTYLPVYYFQVLDIDRVYLAFVQIFSYSAFLIKPLISIYFDTHESKKKSLAIVSAYGIIISFAIIIFILPVLFLFGIMLTINFAFLSLLDVSVDKFLVKSPDTGKIIDKNIVFTQIGAIIGTIFINVAFLVTIVDLYQIDYWNDFFLVLLIGVMPIGLIIWTLKEKNATEKIESPDLGDVNKKRILMMCLFIFLVYGDKLYEFPLEPWILEKFGEELFSFFVRLLIFIIFINLIGIIIAGFISNKFNRKKLLIYSSLSYGLISLLLPFVNVFWFFLLFTILQIIASFIILNMIRIMIQFAAKKVTYFQIMASFFIIARIIFIPLGTYLSTLIPTELIIIISGILITMSIIPLFFL